jgi:hypothetical protein
MSLQTIVRRSSARLWMLVTVALTAMGAAFFTALPSASAATPNASGTTGIVPAAGKPCAQGGVAIKFATGGNGTSGGFALHDAVANLPFQLLFNEVSDNPANTMVFGGVTKVSGTANTDYVVTILYLDNGNDGVPNGDSNSFFTTPAIGASLNPYGTGNLNQVLACVALRFDVTKVVQDVPAGQSHVYGFEVMCSDNGANPITYTMTFTISGSGSQTQEALVPPGFDCTVTETSIDGVAVASASQWIVTGSPTTRDDINETSTIATITNKLSEGRVKFVKTVSGLIFGETTRFDFSATCGAQTFTFSFDGVVDATENPAWTWVSPLLVGGTSCTVTETGTVPAGAWVVTPTATVGPTVVAGGATTDLPGITNTRRVGYFTISKSTDQGSGSFVFTATCGGAVLPNVTVASGTTSAAIGPFGTGTVCTVHEQPDSPDLFVEGGDQTFSITESTKATASDRPFVNTRRVGKLTIVKKVDPATAESFSFSYTCGSGAAVPFTGTGSIAGTIVKTVASIPTGTTCTATETLKAGFLSNVSPAGSTTATAITSGIVTIDADGETITFTNNLLSINVVKSIANTTSSTTCPGTGYVDAISPILANSYVCYQFVITNTSAVPLNSIKLTDNMAIGAVSCTSGVTGVVTASGLEVVSGSLAAGATITCTTTKPIAAQTNVGTSVVNVGTVVGCANVSCTPKATDDDTATYTSAWQGFTPGFWKNHTATDPSGHNAWLARYIGACFDTDGLLAEKYELQATTPWNTTLGETFGITGAFASTKLIDALGFAGGSGVDGATRILLRAAVASYLNSCYNTTVAGLSTGAGGTWPKSPKEIVDLTNVAIATANRTAIIAQATTFDLWNNTGTHFITW